MIVQGHLLLTIISFFGAGLLLAFTPCVFPMIPILSSILAGENNLGTRRAFLLSLTFVLTMALTYAGAGLLAGYFGSTVQTAVQEPWVIVSFSFIFVLMALSMFGLFELRMPGILQNYLQKSCNKQKRGSYTGVVVMGFLSTLIASPCVTAPLVSVLTYIGQTGDAFFGAIILFSLALGMGLPLLIFGLSQGLFLPKSGPWMEKVKQLFGIMMLGLAIWMLSRLLQGPVTLILWASLLIISTISLGGLDFHSERKLPPFIQGLSIFVFIYGCLLLVGASSGHDNIWSPLGYRLETRVTAPAELFTKVGNLPELERKLAEAKENNKPVMIEFYASWCGTCQEVDKDVFSDSSIQESLKQITAIRVDISTKNDELMKLIQHYQVFGTPTLIFYDTKGKRVNTKAFNDGISKETLQEILVKLS